MEVKKMLDILKAMTYSGLSKEMQHSLANVRLESIDSSFKALSGQTGAHLSDFGGSYGLWGEEIAATVDMMSAEVTDAIQETGSRIIDAVGQAASDIENAIYESAKTQTEIIAEKIDFQTKAILQALATQTRILDETKALISRPAQTKEDELFRAALHNAKINNNQECLEYLRKAQEVFDLDPRIFLLRGQILVKEYEDSSNPETISSALESFDWANKIIIPDKSSNLPQHSHKLKVITNLTLLQTLLDYWGDEWEGSGGRNYGYAKEVKDRLDKLDICDNYRTSSPFYWYYRLLIHWYILTDTGGKWITVFDCSMILTVDHWSEKGKSYSPAKGCLDEIKSELLAPLLQSRRIQRKRHNEVMIAHYARICQLVGSVNLFAHQYSEKRPDLLLHPLLAIFEAGIEVVYAKSPYTGLNRAQEEVREKARGLINGMPKPFHLGKIGQFDSIDLLFQHFLSYRQKAYKHWEWTASEVDRCWQIFLAECVKWEGLRNLKWKNYQIPRKILLSQTIPPIPPPKPEPERPVQVEDPAELIRQRQMYDKQRETVGKERQSPPSEPQGSVKRTYLDGKLLPLEPKGPSWTGKRPPIIIDGMEVPPHNQ